MTRNPPPHFLTQILLEVLYGENRPFFGFERVKPDVFTGNDETPSVSIVYRRGVKRKFEPPAALPYS